VQRLLSGSSAGGSVTSSSKRSSQVSSVTLRCRDLAEAKLGVGGLRRRRATQNHESKDLLETSNRVRRCQLSRRRVLIPQCDERLVPVSLARAGATSVRGQKRTRSWQVT
jgi:hypothetical protein